jgi:hypothetical protein
LRLMRTEGKRFRHHSAIGRASRSGPGHHAIHATHTGPHG